MMIKGLADRTGVRNENLLLSQRRARLTDYKGLGAEDAPGQAENRPFSRRVEILVEGTLPPLEKVVACRNSAPLNPESLRSVKNP